MTFAEVHVKRSVILTDRLGPDILLVLTMKRQVLHRERAHLKVPGCSLVLSALLTKKLPTFLSRLNEISGGCEKILPVSGSFWSNLKLLRMMPLTAWLWGWKVRVNGILSFLSFLTFVVMTVDQIVGHDDGPLWPQRQDSHVFRRTGTSPLICWKNRSHHYIDVEVSQLANYIYIFTREKITIAMVT